MPAVEIVNISKSFGEIRALREINLEINDSEIFGLIGPDGSGKTTLFRILVSLLLPDEGRASMCGFDVVREYREIRKRAGYMAGRFSLYQDLTVEENLEFYASVFGTTISKNYDLIKDIYSHIEPFRKRRAGALSGGMKQKLALSCALIHRPEILILDEPTTGVDAVSRTEFWDMLKKIRAEGITILVSTPYMDEASRCDRVGLIQKGRLMSVDEPGKLAVKHKTPLYEIRSSGPVYSLLGILRMQDWCKSAWLFGQSIHLGSSEALTKKQIDAILAGIPGIASIKRIPPGVEDTFIELMSRSELNDEVS